MNLFYGSQLTELREGTVLGEVVKRLDLNAQTGYEIGRIFVHAGNVPSEDPKLEMVAQLLGFPGEVIEDYSGRTYHRSQPPSIPPIDKRQYLQLPRSALHDMVEQVLRMAKAAGVGDKHLQTLLDRVVTPKSDQYEPTPQFKLDEISSTTVKVATGPSRRFYQANYRVVKVYDFSEGAPEDVIWRTLGTGGRTQPRYLVPCPKAISRPQLMRSIAQAGMEPFLADYTDVLTLDDIRALPEATDVESPGLYINFSRDGDYHIGRGFIVLPKRKTK